MTDQEKVECVICLEPVTSQFVLACCHQPCHAQCVRQWKKVRHTISCPHCRQAIPITTLDVVYPELWKEDAYFVERVSNVWKDNRFWYGICHNEDGSQEGFWGELKDSYETTLSMLDFELSCHGSPLTTRTQTPRSQPVHYHLDFGLLLRDAADHSGPGTRSRL